MKPTVSDVRDKGSAAHMAEVLRVSIIGAMPTGEEWSVNPVYSIGGDFGTTVTPQQAQTIATAIAAVAAPGAILAAWVPATTLSGCRVEARALDGTLETQAEAIKATPQVGTGASPHPFQVALVSSLRTAFPGARGRGRLYWPATGINISSSTLRPISSTVVSVLGGVKTYLSAIQTAIDATLDGVALGVWSRTSQDVNVVQSIQMGDVLDTQRRRRDTLVEVISSTPYP
jgi:hypothetical protein